MWFLSICDTCLVLQQRAEALLRMRTRQCCHRVCRISQARAGKKYSLNEAEFVFSCLIRFTDVRLCRSGLRCVCRFGAAAVVCVCLCVFVLMLFG